MIIIMLFKYYIVKVLCLIIVKGLNSDDNKKKQKSSLYNIQKDVPYTHILLKISKFATGELSLLYECFVIIYLVKFKKNKKTGHFFNLSICIVNSACLYRQMCDFN